MIFHNDSSDIHEMYAAESLPAGRFTQRVQLLQETGSAPECGLETAEHTGGPVAIPGQSETLAGGISRTEVDRGALFVAHMVWMPVVSLGYIQRK